MTTRRGLLLLIAALLAIATLRAACARSRTPAGAAARADGVESSAASASAPAPGALDPDSASAADSRAPAGAAIGSAACDVLVVDALTSLPVPDALIHTASAAEGAEPIARTDGDGRARIASAAGEPLDVSKDGYLTHSVRERPAPRARLRVQLVPECRLRLRLEDRAGAAIAGVALEFAVESADSDPSDADARRARAVVRAFGTTDADGRCERAGLPRGARVQIWFDAAVRTLTLDRASALSEQTLVIDETAALEGRVVDSAGIARANELVTLTSLGGAYADRASRTDPRGGFRFDRLPGGPARVECGEACTVRRTFRLLDREQLRVGDIELPDAARLRGRIVGLADGLAPEGLRVAAWRDGIALASVAVDVDAGFEMRTSAGPVELVVSAGAEREVLARQPARAPADLLEIDVAPSLHELALELDDALADQAVDVAIFDVASTDAARVAASARPRPLASWSGVRLRGRTLRLPTASARSVDLEVRTSATRGAFVRAVTTASAGGAADRRARTAKVGSARVEFDAALPRSRASSPTRASVQATLLRWNGRETFRIDDLDRPAVTDLRPGPALLCLADDDGIAWWSASVELDAGAVLRLSTPRSSGAAIRGYVRDWSSSNAARQATLSCVTGVGDARRALDSAGRFEFDDLAPGRYVVAVADLGRMLVRLDAGQVADVVFELPEQRLVTLRRAGTPVESILSAELWRIAPREPSVQLHVAAPIHPTRSSFFLPALSGTYLIRFQLFERDAPSTALVLVEPAALRDGDSIALGTGSVRFGCDREPSAAHACALDVISIDGVPLGALAACTLDAERVADAWVCADLPDRCAVAIRADACGCDGSAPRLAATHGDVVVRR